MSTNQEQPCFLPRYQNEYKSRTALLLTSVPEWVQIKNSALLLTSVPELVQIKNSLPSYLGTRMSANQEQPCFLPRYQNECKSKTALLLTSVPEWVQIKNSLASYLGTRMSANKEHPCFLPRYQNECKSRTALLLDSHLTLVPCLRWRLLCSLWGTLVSVNFRREWRSPLAAAYMSHDTFTLPCYLGAGVWCKLVLGWWGKCSPPPAQWRNAPPKNFCVPKKRSGTFFCAPYSFLCPPEAKAVVPQIFFFASNAKLDREIHK